jgi:hypothetical protein
LAVNGSGADPISAAEFGNERKFRIWHFNFKHEAPLLKGQKEFEKMINELMERAIRKEDPLPFLRSDVEYIENLTMYLDIYIPNQYRSFGQEFLDGKAGDVVRMRSDLGRIYFKWQKIKRWLISALSTREKELDAYKMFITRVGGYQGEDGAREWFRWTYWVPMAMFGEETRVRWFEVETKQEGGGE